ncbi:hypothetical protein HUG10_07545 [Halorarum halophilum]|uniref:Halobacterial output domain-containing protein n=1 Tax=Halorarum halophilum TaxID=2743090 RepID=A0A7D5GF49_9EURY|nr:HalOD1 output domain-containing protein [Halobaculum halophilum]QLG27410.1 hypothetical protein HUG10_07545 [Halobaculum halophilum]
MTDEDPRSMSNISNSTPSAQPPSPSLEQSLFDFKSFEYHEDESAYRAIYSHDVGSPSSAVVSAVAAASDTDPLDMNSLNATVDTDALNSLVTQRRDAVGDLHITFEYHGYEVTASSYGGLKVKPLQANPPLPPTDD